MNSALKTCWLVCLITCFPWHAFGQPPGIQADEAAIRQSANEFVNAFNRGDAAAIAALWSENAEYTTPDGETLVGRTAIHELYQQLFAKSKGLKLKIQDLVIRVPQPGIGVEEGTAIVTRDGQVTEQTRYTARHAKVDGQWRLTGVSESLANAAPSNYEHLKELEWMVGQWVDANGEAAIKTTCRWSKNRNFLTRYFTVALDGQVEHEGMQIIGYDAVCDRIQSWVFDSDGGTGRGIWTQQGNSWAVAASYKLPDGSQGTATNVFSLTNTGDFTWKSIKRTIDGKPIPDVPELTATRIE